jgi:hypothetical protein
MARVSPRLLLAGTLLLLILAAPASVTAAAGPAPGETCVPGTVWEDPASGVKYLCIYDEAFGGPRWVLLSGGQRGAAGWPYRSPTDGCLHLGVGLAASSGGGGDVVARTYRWPCASGYRVAQPAGELRVRVVLQRYTAGTWSTCRDSGYHYSSGAAFGWVAGLDMGSAADCGSGSYRAHGYGAFLGAGAWRGGSFLTPYAWLP